MTTAQPAPGHPTAARLLQQLLQRAGWRAVTVDRYAAAAGTTQLEPVRPRRAPGHTPAQLRFTGDVVGLSTHAADGATMEAVTWSWVDPGNLQRVHDYVTAALADALAERGQL